MRHTATQFAQESVGPFSFRGPYVRELLSHSKQDCKNISCTQFASEDVGLFPFYNSYVKEHILY